MFKLRPSMEVAITHDRYFLDNVAGWILELDRGEGIPFEGNYSTWLESKAGGLLRTRTQPTLNIILLLRASV